MGVSTGWKRPTFSHGYSVQGSDRVVGDCFDPQCPLADFTLYANELDMQLSILRPIEDRAQTEPLRNLIRACPQRQRDRVHDGPSWEFWSGFSPVLMHGA